MKKIRLGRTGLMVSEIGFGGIPVTRLDLQEAVDLIAYCFEKGINFFDTANMYGDSEEKIGRALEDVRDQVILATKSRKLDGGGLKEHMTRSLEMLRTDYIDLFQIHNLSKPEELERALAPGGACEALAQAKDEGIIRHIGFSSHNPDTALKACRTGLFTTVQIPFNFVEPQVEEKVFAAAREMDMGLIAMKPLGGGLLDRADLCFAFLRQYPDVVPIPGVQAKEEIDEIISLYGQEAKLSADQKAEMENFRRELGPRWCHRCGYCQPCPEGIEIPYVLMFRSVAKRSRPERVVNMLDGVMKQAQECVQCGECETKCPYELPIPEMIGETLGYYQEFVNKHGLIPQIVKS